MNVYIVVAGDQWEGEDIISVWLDEHQAMLAAQAYAQDGGRDRDWVDVLLYVSDGVPLPAVFFNRTAIYSRNRSAR